MQHIEFLLKNFPIKLDVWYSRVRLLVLIFSFILNFIILFDKYVKECPKQCPDGETDPCVCPESTETELQSPIKGIGITILVLSILNFVLWSILQLKLDILKSLRRYETEYIN
jgi:hypothetical protein